MSGIDLFVSDSYGVYIPQRFVDKIDLGRWNGISTEDYELLLRGPDHEDAQGYWDAWDAVTRDAFCRNDDGNIWRLWQDGDLWVYCEALMTDEEYYNFFGEHRSALDLEDYWPHGDLDSDSRLETDNWYDTSAELH